MELVDYNTFLEIASRLSPMQISNLCQANKLLASYCRKGEEIWEQLYRLRYSRLKNYDISTINPYDILHRNTYNRTSAFTSEPNISYSRKYAREYKKDLSQFRTAIVKKDYATVLDMIDLGIDLNHEYVYLGILEAPDYKMIKLLLDHGTMANQELLYDAYIRQDDDIFLLLIEYGAVIKSLREEIIENILFSSPCDRIGLIMTKQVIPLAKSLNIVRKIGNDYYTPLSYALKKNCRIKARLLLKAGAKLSIHI